MNLFQGAGLGNLGITNMGSAGSFPSDQTFVVLSLQVFLHFRKALTPPQAIGTAPAEVIHHFYYLAQEQLFWTFTVGDKPLKSLKISGAVV